MENGKKSAFPILIRDKRYTDGRMTLKYEGLTKREYFAAMAMQGILAKHGLPTGWEPKDLPSEVASAAHASVVVADELLKALETNQTKQ